MQNTLQDDLRTLAIWVVIGGYVILNLLTISAVSIRVLGGPDKLCSDNFLGVLVVVALPAWVLVVGFVLSALAEIAREGTPITLAEMQEALLVIAVFAHLLVGFFVALNTASPIQLNCASQCIIPTPTTYLTSLVVTTVVGLGVREYQRAAKFPAGLSPELQDMPDKV